VTRKPSLIVPRSHTGRSFFAMPSSSRISLARCSSPSFETTHATA
jgi:hypothetical protein